MSIFSLRIQQFSTLSSNSHGLIAFSRGVVGPVRFQHLHLVVDVAPPVVLVCLLAGAGARANLVLDFWGSQTWSFLWLHLLDGARAKIQHFWDSPRLN